MSNDLAKKDLPISKGVNYLKDGYIDYAWEIINERAIANIYDGLKPVHRKLLWTFFHDTKKGATIKSATVTGNTMAYHPHNQEAIYQAGVLLTDNHEGTQFPLIDGVGSFGNESSGARASAMRYTEMRLHANAQEFFREIDGIDMMPNFDATKTEPVVLPVSFPFVLCNPSEGIAVGFSSKIPSFNFNDVIDLTIEYLRDGHCHSVIAPDFMTGGYYVQNNKELKKLMEVGKASCKLRAKITVQNDKEIFVSEVPYGKSVAKLASDIDDKDFDGVTAVANLCDFEGIGLSISCRSKKAVDEVLYHLYKDTDLQYNYNANITVVQDGVPKQMGVYRVIEEWCNWRKEVVKKDTLARIESCKNRMRESQAFMTLVESTEKRDEFIRLVTTEGRESGKEYILNNFTREEIPEDLIQFISSRALNSYHTGGKYAVDFQAAKMELKGYEEDLADLNVAIIKQLQRVKSLYGGNCPRRTEISMKDFEFNKVEEVKALDTSKCWYTLKDNFFKKIRAKDESTEYAYQIEGRASDTLIAFDNRGRLLRIYAKDLSYDNIVGAGTYLPRYLGLNETDDYKILWMDRLDGSTKTLLYEDGNIGFLDESEFMDSSRQVRILNNGISKEAGKIVEVFDEVPEVLMVTDNEGRISWTYMADVKVKGRTARTKVFNIKKGNRITSYCVTDATNLLILLNNSNNYKAPSVRFLDSKDDYRGDSKTFIGC